MYPLKVMIVTTRQGPQRDALRERTSLGARASCVLGVHATPGSARILRARHSNSAWERTHPARSAFKLRHLGSSRWVYDFIRGATQLTFFDYVLSCAGLTRHQGFECGFIEDQQVRTLD